jgi:hypothetical protein
MEKQKPKKKYSKRTYSVIGDISFTKQEFSELYSDEDGWKNEYFVKIKQKIVSELQKQVVTGKKFKGSKSCAVYLKCSNCLSPALIKSKPKLKEAERIQFSFSTTCNCKIQEKETEGEK